LVFPLPIFLVDDVLEAGEAMLWLLGLKFGRHLPLGRLFWSSQSFLRGGLPKVREAWRKVRRSGSFTLLETAQHSGVQVTIKFI